MVELTIPSDLSAGTHTLTATGVGPDGATRVLSLRFTVGGLPLTGNRFAVVAGTGGLILLMRRPGRGLGGGRPYSSPPVLRWHRW